jgi:hypothetical protein
VDLEARVRALLEPHPAVRAVSLVGSRGAGGAGALSDWDFAVATVDFDGVARDLPELVEPLEPLARQWDRYSEIECYLLMLPGAVKVDLLFPDRPRVDALPPWEASADTLAAIDDHFWDWILWIAQKASREPAGVGALLERQHRLLLRPIGVERRPATVADALGAYLAARETLEERLDVRAPRRLGEEVLARLARHGQVPKYPQGVPRDP